MSSSEPSRNEFLVAHEAERLALLRHLCEEQLPLTLHAPDGSALRARLHALDAEAGRMALAVDTTAPALASLVESNEATALGYPGQVRLQFELEDLWLVQGPEGGTLQCAVPRELWRFQRRGSYRVAIGAGAPPTVRLRHPAIPEMMLALRVLDLSQGGCALWLPGDVPPLDAGTQWAEVQLQLDGHNTLRMALTLQHVGAPLPGGAGVRCGCEWEPLRADDRRVLQCWIDQAQKRQRLLERR